METHVTMYTMIMKFFIDIPNSRYWLIRQTYTKIQIINI